MKSVTLFISFISFGLSAQPLSGPKTPDNEHELACISFSKRSDHLLGTACANSKILDSDFFRSTKPVIALEKGRLRLLLRRGIFKDSLLMAGYEEIASRVGRKGVEVKALIGRKDVYVFVETGFEGGILLRRDKCFRFLNEPNTQRSIGFADGAMARIYKNRGIKILGSYYGTSVAILEKFPSTVGLSFIKGFDWIIDFESKRVFARKNSTRISSDETLANQ